MLAIHKTVDVEKNKPFPMQGSSKSSVKKKKKLNKQQKKKRQKEAKLKNSNEGNLKPEVESSSSKVDEKLEQIAGKNIHEKKTNGNLDSNLDCKSNNHGDTNIDIDKNTCTSEENGVPTKKTEVIDSKIVKGIQFVYPRNYSSKSRSKPEKYNFAKQRKIESELMESFGTLNDKVDDTNVGKKVDNSLKDETIEDILFPNKKKKNGNKNKLKIEHGIPEIEKNDTKIIGSTSESTQSSDSINVKKQKENNKSEKSKVKDDQKVHHDAENNPLTKNKKENMEKISSKSDKSLANKEVNRRKRSLSEDYDTNSKNQKLSGLTVEDAINDKVGRRPRSNSTDGELNLPRRGLCDERMVLESHKWNLDKMYGKHKEKRPRGFVNLGNTCFLNATLQCLTYLPTFCQCVALSSADGIKANGKVSNGKKITLALRSLVRKAHGMDNAEGKTNTIAPKEIVRAVPLLGGSSRGYKFRPGRQEDAHEFLVHLLDAMNDGELKAAGINQNKSGWRDRLPIPRLDETTFIHRMFGGYLRSQVHCTTCGHNSNTYDPFLDLSLEVSKKSCTNISAAFADFTRKETLDTENKYKCSGCLKRVCATKQLTVFRPPLTLCIQLKRFTFGSSAIGGLIHSKRGWGYGHFAGKGMNMRGGGKIQKPIEFPATLKLPLSDGRKCAYDLTGLIIHVGGSATSGHYTAYVKKPESASGKSWYHMDDSFVETVSTKAVLKQKDAYVLFYSRKEVKLELPNPPRRVSMTAEEARNVNKARANAKSILLKNQKPQACPSVAQSTMDIEAANDKVSKVEVKSSTNTENMLTPPVQEDSEIRNLLSEAPESDSDSASSSSGSSRSPTSNLSNESPPPHSLKTVKKSLDSAMAKTMRHQVERNELEKNTKDIKKSTSTATKITTGKKSPKGKKVLTVDRGLVQGSVQVVIGKRKKSKSWQPTHSNSGSNAIELLGDKGIDKWDEEELPSSKKNKSIFQRKKMNQELKSVEKKRKRKMYLDNWDAKLDEGKKKKIKAKKDSKEMDMFNPKLNLFQHIQTKNQREKHVRR